MVQETGIWTVVVKPKAAVLHQSWWPYDGVDCSPGSGNELAGLVIQPHMHTSDTRTKCVALHVIALARPLTTTVPKKTRRFRRRNKRPAIARAQFREKAG